MSDQAMKLFEALSGVDEELLERCEQRVQRKGMAAYRLFGKYGRSIAAAFCLIAVGAAAWSGYRFVTGSYGSDASGSNGATAQLSDMEQSVLTADGGDCGGAAPSAGMTGSDMALSDGTAGGGVVTGPEADGIREEAPSSAASAEAASAETQQDVMQSAQGEEDRSSSVASTENLASPAESGVSEMESAAEKMEAMRRKESGLMDSREQILWEEAIALKPFADHIPTVLPGGYEPLSARRSTLPDSWNNVIYKWSEGEHILSLNMTLGEVKTEEDIVKEDGLNEYLAKDFRRELMPEPLDGQIQFTLYYSDGMKIDFAGYITVDEMWDMVESVLE